MTLGKTRVSVMAAMAAVVTVAMLPAAAKGPSSSSGPAGCDNTRPGVSYGAAGTNPQPANDVVPCLTYTFADYGESGIVVTPPIALSNGATAPSAVMQGGIYQEHPNPAYPSWGNLARTVDEGAHWGRVLFSGNQTEVAGNEGADSGFYFDPFTKRLFSYSDGSPTELEVAMNLAYSDTGGETWVDNPGPPLQFATKTSNDASVMFGGPPRTSADKAALATIDYPDVTYWCFDNSSKCFKSLDGGINFTEITDSAGTDEAGTNGAVAAGPTGILYGSLSSGQLNVSYDDGATWTRTAGTVPAGFAQACMRPSTYGSLSVDNQGDIYVGGLFNDQLAVTYSKDGGVNWAKPVQLQMPGSSVDTQANLCTFSSDWGRPGHFAAAWIGASSSDTSAAHHGFLAMTADLFDPSPPSPTFTGVQVDSNSHPLFPNGAPCNILHESAAGPCAPHTVSARLDYISVTFSPVDGQPWGIYAADACSFQACPDKANPSDPVGTVNQSQNYEGTNWRGAVGTMTSGLNAQSRK